MNFISTRAIALRCVLLAVAASVTTPAQAGLFFWRSKPAQETPQQQPQPKPSPTPSKPRRTPSSEAGSNQASAQTSVSAAPKVSLKALSQEQRDRNVRLQIFLDRKLFSPAKIDGKGGASTLRALNAYLRSTGASPVQDEKSFNVDQNGPLYTTYKIETDHLRFVASFAGQRYALPYTSVTEFLCERFHCTEELLSVLNPTQKLNALRAGAEITVPDVEPFRLEDVVPTAALPEKEEFKGRTIHISLSDRFLTVAEEDKPIAAFPIAIGTPSLPTPKGKWRIYGICVMPSYRWDPGVLSHGVRTSTFKMLPPGPNNPVGVVWCALNKSGIGIHGTNNPDSIGNAASHGCMRVANWDVSRLAKLISPGTQVHIE